MQSTVTAIRTQAPLEVEGIWKRYGDRDVVRNVSFEARPDRVLGIVGPNGAGKTTSIRIALGVLRPDLGNVRVLGAPLNQRTKARIGYLPEERGLYRGQPVLDTLVYLGQMKRMTRDDARRSAEELLDRLGMTPHRGKKVQELSHGMAQLIQFAATIVHRPELVVLDEPFNGLDPVNARLMKDVILEMREAGTALVLSSHQMNTVEELCDQVVMIDRGMVVLSGDLTEVRRRFRGDALRIVCQPWPDTIHGVADVRREGRGYVMRLLPETTPDAVLHQLVGEGCSVEHFDVAVPSMEEIFVSVVRGSHE